MKENEKLSVPSRKCLRCEKNDYLSDPFRLCTLCRSWLERLWCKRYYMKKNATNSKAYLYTLKPFEPLSHNYTTSQYCGCWEDMYIRIFCKKHAKEHNGKRVENVQAVS